ncbi:MAG TPA: acetoacetate--CoA ligase [Burkholderiales bacterium]|nr:acetoacetate--CoA ligase [Burkholderiales bacterium]
MARPIEEGTVLWEPPPERREATGLARYQRWLAEHKGVRFDDYNALWRWSVEHLEDFWASLWEFFEIRASAPYSRVLDARKMPGAKWFEGARLNYAEHAFRCASPDRPALIVRSESRPPAEISWVALEREVAAIAAGLREMGVGPGDRVASYMPNIPETISGFLACASLGAVWSSCSPDMGAGTVVDRFKQIEPKVLFAVDGYRYGGKAFDRRAVVAEIVGALPSLERVVFLPYLDPLAKPEGLPNAVLFEQLVARTAGLAFEQVPFEHPLWVVYSSGTTGLPKAIVHGHGGCLLEHLKTVLLQLDVHPGDRYFWVSSTGWIVWNLLVEGLLAGCTLVVFDGNPAAPDAGTIWRLLGETRTAHFGCGAALIAASMKAGVEPARLADLSALQAISVTGSPLTVDGFAWLYEHVKRDLWVASISGGTDIASGLVAGCALAPVRAGEIQGRCLGVAVAAFDEHGRPLVGEVGELVVTEPMPSMPLYFWNDPGGRRYLESYFEMYPGKWRHGDWIRITDRGSCVIYGRSDTTINRHGIRMGTAEIYRAVEGCPEVTDSLVVDLEYLGRPSHLALFVVLRPGDVLDDALKARVKASIRTLASARHVPDEVYAIEEVPRTLTGKKLELPVRKLLLGAPLEKVASPGAMANPRSLGFFVELAKRLAV